MLYCVRYSDCSCVRCQQKLEIVHFNPRIHLSIHQRISGSSL